MTPKETEQRFLSRVSEFLVSLPFDLKVLQEAASDADLEMPVRELAAGAVVHTLSPQEGEGLLRFVDDVFYVRAALAEVVAGGGDAVDAFRDRFAAEVYDTLDEDNALFAGYLGDLWTWLSAKIGSFSKIPFKGKRASQYPHDDAALTLLYEEGLEFQTNYSVTEEQVRNKLRRADQVTEVLNRRRAEEAKKIG